MWRGRVGSVSADLCGYTKGRAVVWQSESQRKKRNRLAPGWVIQAGDRNGWQKRLKEVGANAQSVERKAAETSQRASAGLMQIAHDLSKLSGQQDV